MNNLSQHIAQLKEVLKLIEEYLEKYTDEDLLAEKVSQLNNIEKTIRNLQKSKTTIPGDLRKLKLNLVNETDNWQEAKTRKPEIFDILQTFISKHSWHSSNQQAKQKEKRITKKPRVKKFTEQVQLSDLLESGIIIEGIELFRIYKGDLYKAFLKPDGTLETQVNGKLEKFATTSAAAVAVSNKSQNGWVWWFTSFEGTKRELDYYRKKYLDSINS
jgi:hypothetical protein